MTLDMLKFRNEVQNYHDKRGIQPMRWATLNGSHSSTLSGGCFYSVQHSVAQDHDILATVFHGDGPEFDFSELVSTTARNAKTAATTRGWDQFEGTPRSKLWVDFLLSPQSPWKDLLPFLAETDAGYINNAGFLWKDLKKIPKKLWYNFTMATRFPWELPHNYSTWLHLREHFKGSVDDNTLLFIASNFVLAEGAKSMEGPWTIVYPWSFLEFVSLDAAGRFIKSRPATLSATEGCSPNVEKLWVTQKDQKNYIKLTDDLSTRADLTLTEILGIVSECVEKQEKSW